MLFVFTFPMIRDTYYWYMFNYVFLPIHEEYKLLELTAALDGKKPELDWFEFMQQPKYKYKVIGGQTL
jgi:hypothetical protein